MAEVGVNCPSFLRVWALGLVWGCYRWFMNDKHQDPVVVGEYPTEFEASLIKNMLSMEGVPSELVGAMTAGFRAETPGMVKVLVPGSFAELAREIIAAQELGGVDDEELQGEDI